MEALVEMNETSNDPVTKSTIYIFDQEYFAIEVVQLIVLISATVVFMILRKQVTLKFFVGSWLVVLI